MIQIFGPAPDSGARAFAVTGVLKSLLFQVFALDAVALAMACVLMTPPHGPCGSVTGTEAGDPMFFVAPAIMLLLVSIVAGVIPACRAIRIDPIRALRHE